MVILRDINKIDKRHTKDMFRFTVPNTYGKQYTDYLVFEDGTKVNRLHCDFV